MGNTPSQFQLDLLRDLREGAPEGAVFKEDRILRALQREGHPAPREALRKMVRNGLLMQTAAEPSVYATYYNG